jgi:hypothetical protein
VRANAILVRWKGGWRWVDDVVGLRIEISQGHAGDSSEVVRKAQAELDTYSAGQTQVTVGIDVPPGGPVPSVDWIEGDEVHVDGAWQEVEALTCSMSDETGRWTDIPQFGTVLDDPEERIARTVRNIGGLNGGTSHVARPVQTIQQQPNVRPT